MNKKLTICNILLYGIMLFLVLIYAPLELYFTNIGEFWYDMSTLLPALVVVYICLFLLGVGLIWLFVNKLPKWIGNILPDVMFVITVCTYIQGNFLVGNLPQIGNNTINWDDYQGERIATIALWVIVILSVVILTKLLDEDKKIKIYRYLSVALFAVLFITLITLSIINNGFQKKTNLMISTAKENEYSSDENFIVLLLDAVDSQAFLNELEKDDDSDIFFDGFTYYRDAMGGYPFTMHSIPFILGGEWYDNGEDFSDYCKRAYLNSPLINCLESKNYSLGIYDTNVTPSSSDFSKYENISEYADGVVSWSKFTRWGIMQGLFRYVPYDLKRWFVIDQDAVNGLKLAKAGYTPYTESNLDFYNLINSNTLSVTHDKKFKFIHVTGAHLPHIYDKDLNIIKNGDYSQNIGASLTITRSYLNMLKASDVYDNSVIIVMADHGWMENDLKGMHRQNPLFMVKGKNENHNMEYSDCPMSYVDLQSAFLELLDGQKADNIFPWTEDSTRTRRYIYYEYLHEEDMYEYIQTGKATDELVPTGEHYHYELN